MKKSLLVRLAILLMITSTLSGCLWFVDDGGRGEDGGGGHHGGERGGGEHHGDHR